MKPWQPAALGAALLITASPALAGEWTGYVSAEARFFQNDAKDPRQHGGNLSLAAQPEYYAEWDQGRQSFTFVPFARWDQGDPERSHADIRELTWLMAADAWELRAGIRKLFWGVTESEHLVDIINQTDLVESLDGEEKLGQPMLNLALIRDWGTLDLFILPYFRERTFPGGKGRLRFALPVDTSRPEYESSRKERHVDYAARWEHSLGDWDVGLSYFHGTSRDPRFTVRDDGQALLPVYDLIQQWGLDLQATLGDWLWKLETIRRSGQGGPYQAAVGGFEYTFVGIAGSFADLGVIAEYLYDQRGREALTPFADDLMLGARLTLNDEQSTELLAGLIVDLKDDSRVLTLESSRRLGDSWKISLEGYLFQNIAINDFLYSLRRDDYIQLEVARYF